MTLIHTYTQTYTISTYRLGPSGGMGRVAVVTNMSYVFCLPFLNYWMRLENINFRGRNTARLHAHNFLSTLQHGKHERWLWMDRNDYPDEDGNENGLDIIGRRAHLTFHPARSGAPAPPSPAVWPDAKQNDDGLVFQFGRNLRAYFCLANSILTCSTSSILLHQANTNSSSCFG